VITQQKQHYTSQYIAGFLMVGAFAHGAIFFVRDYDPEINEGNVLARMLDHKDNYFSLKLGIIILRFPHFRIICTQ
jgi:photosystem I P700 chlorophyll a apoprotein A2